MKKRIIPMLLCLLLLAGCTPAVPPVLTPLPTPSVTPSVSAAPEINFADFLRQINDGRRAVIQEAVPIDITAWTDEFSEQNSTYTEADMERLTAPHDSPSGGLTREELLEDVDAFFLLLKTTYGAYEYFGGDEVFLPLRDEVRAEVEEMAGLYVWKLEKVLSAHLAPVLTDGHFAIGDTRMRTEHARYMYYVPDLYFTDTTGLNMDCVKPTIGPDGAVTYCFAAMSHDGKDLPTSLGGNDLSWRQADRTPYDGVNAFEEKELGGTPVLVSRKMSASVYYPEQAEQLERFAACGDEYTGKTFIFDVRSNGGGSDIWVMDWFEGWAGQPARPRRSFAHRFSQLGCRMIPDGYKSEYMGNWSGFASEGGWTRNSGTVFALTDKGTASSGETAVEFLRSADNVVFVGGPTMGCSLVPNNLHFYLPNSGLELYFGTGLSFKETDENRDGIGYLPDLWVNPPDAQDAVLRLIDYYGLREKET